MSIYKELTYTNRKSGISYNKLNIMRGIACVFVILIHSPLPLPIGEYIISIGRFAVPFFIVASGYFSYYDDAKIAQKKVVKHLKKIGRLLAFVVILYSISNSIVCYIQYREFYRWIVEAITFDNIIKLVIFNRAVFLCSIAYYLLMLIYVYVIYKHIIDRNLLRLSYKFIPVLLLLNIVINEIIGLEWFYVGNWLLTGLPFFLLGNYLHSLDIRKKIKPYSCIGLVIVGVILSVLETVFFGSFYCSLGTVVLVIGIFLFCILNDKTSIFNKLLGDLIRKYSEVLFLIHLAVRDLLILFGVITAEPSWTSFLIVFLVSVIITSIYLGASRWKVNAK